MRLILTGIAEADAGRIRWVGSAVCAHIAGAYLLLRLGKALWLWTPTREERKQLGPSV
jgi:hypothetical protein